MNNDIKNKLRTYANRMRISEGQKWAIVSFFELCISFVYKLVSAMLPAVVFSLIYDGWLFIGILFIGGVLKLIYDIFGTNSIKDTLREIKWIIKSK